MAEDVIHPLLFSDIQSFTEGERCSGYMHSGVLVFVLVLVWHVASSAPLAI
jgi:hypothetical protein